MRIFLLVATLVWGVPALAETATIVEGERVKMRSGKYDTYRVVKALEPGTVVEILKQEKSYVQVKTAAGDVGWLSLRLVKKVGAHPPPPPPPEPGAAPDMQKTEQAPAPVEIKPNVKTQYMVSLWALMGIGSAGLLTGILLGMGAMLAHYRKKLNGLRI